MVVTLSGIVMLVRPVQPLNACAPIVVTEPGIVIPLPFNDVHPLNDKAPIVVTLFDNVTEASAVYPLNAPSIVVTQSPTWTELTLLLLFTGPSEDDSVVLELQATSPL